MSPDPQGPEHGLQPTPDPAPERTPPSSALRWIIGLSLVVTISIATCLLGGTRFPFSLFWNPVAGVLVVNLTFALLLMTYSVGEILGTLMLPLSAPGRHREERLHRLESCALSGSRYSLSAGAIGYLMGLVQTLQFLSDVAALGPSVAVCLLSLLYGLLLSEVLFQPVAALARRRLDHGLHPPERFGRGGSLLPVMLYSMMALGAFSFILVHLWPPHRWR